VQDSKKYNEWVNAIDYETEIGLDEHDKYKQELEARGISPQEAARKRDASGLPAGGGAAKVQVVQHEVDPHSVENVGEGIVRRRVLTPYKRAMDGTANSENLSQGQLPKLLEGSSAAMAMAAVQVCFFSAPCMHRVCLFLRRAYAADVDTCGAADAMWLLGTQCKRQTSPVCFFEGVKHLTTVRTSRDSHYQRAQVASVATVHSSHAGTNSRIRSRLL
jgi:hypothetical protein